MTVKEFIGTLESSDRLRIIEGKAEAYVGYLAAFKPFADHEISEEYRKYSGHEVKKFWKSYECLKTHLSLSSEYTGGETPDSTDDEVNEEDIKNLFG